MGGREGGREGGLIPTRTSPRELRESLKFRNPLFSHPGRIRMERCCVFRRRWRPRKADFEDTGISEIPVSLLSDDVLRRRRRQEEEKEEEVSLRIP